MSSLDIYHNMLTYAHSDECPVERRMDIISAAADILNHDYKLWADSQPQKYDYQEVKKEKVHYNEQGKPLQHVYPKKEGFRAKMTRGVSWIYQIDIKKNLSVAKYRTLEEAAKAIMGEVGNISHAINGHAKTAYGYRWRRIKSRKIKIKECK